MLYSLNRRRFGLEESNLTCLINKSEESGDDRGLGGFRGLELINSC